MFAKVNSVHYVGLDSYKVDVEVHIVAGLPAFNIVGLPDTAIKEARERVRSAIINSEYEFPMRKITVNLAPADLKKEGPAFDLPIAIGILKATRQIKKSLNNYSFVGELSLMGRLRPIRGALLLSEATKKNKLETLFIPKENAKEAALVDGVGVAPVENLGAVISILNENDDIEYESPDGIEARLNEYSLDINEVKGQLIAKRALEIAAAGGHNLLMVGSPGAGKSMLAKRMPSIMPRLSKEEIIEITKIYSILGLTSNGNIVKQRPFRSPHHTISYAALVGGSAKCMPGEISLSHLGVLFLDELTEFNRIALESLRQPLEDGNISISRALKRISYPANFCLVTAMNPCKCGFYGDKVRQCVCTPNEVRKYRQKISGPLMDRIDLHVKIDRLSKEELISYKNTKSSQEVRQQVIKASNLQKKRFRNSTNKTNSRMTTKQIKDYCHLENDEIDFISKAVDKLGLSGRSYDKILKVARTIADLDEKENIGVEHLAEAIQYRQYDRKEIYT